MGSGQIYKGTQSFALYWVGAAAAATSASEQSSVRISVCQSVLLLLQPPLHILKTETFYFVANLFRFVLLFFFVGVDVVVVGFLWLFELFLIYGDAKVFCCKMQSTFLLLRRRCRLRPLLILHRSLTL